MRIKRESALQVHLSRAVTTSIDYPFHHSVFLGSTIGGVTLKPNSKAIQSAEAVRLFYFLKDAKTEMDRSENGAWLQAFIKTFSEEIPVDMVSICHSLVLLKVARFN